MWLTVDFPPNLRNAVHLMSASTANHDHMTLLPSVSVSLSLSGREGRATSTSAAVVAVVVLAVCRNATTICHRRRTAPAAARHAETL